MHARGEFLIQGEGEYLRLYEKFHANWLLIIEIEISNFEKISYK